MTNSTCLFWSPCTHRRPLSWFDHRQLIKWNFYYYLDSIIIMTMVCLTKSPSTSRQTALAVPAPPTEMAAALARAAAVRHRDGRSTRRGSCKVADRVPYIGHRFSLVTALRNADKADKSRIDLSPVITPIGACPRHGFPLYTLQVTQLTRLGQVTTSADQTGTAHPLHQMLEISVIYIQQGQNLFLLYINRSRPGRLFTKNLTIGYPS